MVKPAKALAPQGRAAGTLLDPLSRLSMGAVGVEKNAKSCIFKHTKKYTYIHYFMLPWSCFL